MEIFPIFVLKPLHSVEPVMAGLHERSRKMLFVRIPLLDHLSRTMHRRNFNSDLNKQKPPEKKPKSRFCCCARALLHGLFAVLVAFALSVAACFLAAVVRDLLLLVIVHQPVDITNKASQELLEACDPACLLRSESAESVGK